VHEVIQASSENTPKRKKRVLRHAASFTAHG
jgi:hypothetical protein